MLKVKFSWKSITQSVKDNGMIHMPKCKIRKYSLKQQLFSLHVHEVRLWDCFSKAVSSGSSFPQIRQAGG